MAHPFKHESKTGQERAHERYGSYADGGDVDPNMDRAKNYIRGMTAMAPKSNLMGVAGTWSGKSASDHAADDTQEMADSIRHQKKGD